MRRLDWPDLVVLRAVTDARERAEPLGKAVRRALRTAPVAPSGDAGRAGQAGDALGLEDVLDAIDAGLLRMAVADRMPKPRQAARLTGASARNLIRPVVWDALAGIVDLHLIAEGSARPEVSWADRARLVLPEAWEEGMDAAIDAAVGDTPDTSALRALLARDDRAAGSAGSTGPTG